MIATIVIAIFAGVAFGIAAYCLKGLRDIKNIQNLYEDYITDLIKELEVYRDADYNN